jgi:hypothetical protein
MPRYRALVSTYKDTETPKDYITNTIYFDDQRVGTDAGNLAQDIATAFATWRVPPAGFNRVTVKMYDMAEPQPREIQAQRTVNMSPGPTASGPREVALCLSFHGERNLPRQRGRIYLGPFQSTPERPPYIPEALALAESLKGIGGLDVDWCVFSPTESKLQGWTDAAGGTPKFHAIKGGWCDNEWDTQRSRGLRATTRNTFTANE